ncbi:MAG: putative membrane protein [Paracoccaceae bacterium]
MFIVDQTMTEDPIEPIGQPREIKHPHVRKAIKPFLAGMATVIPVLATGWIVVLVFRLLHKIGLAIINGFLTTLNTLRGTKQGSQETWTLDGFPGDDFLWLLIPLALLFLVGIAVTNRPGKKITAWIDDTMIRIPLFGVVYATIKQFVDAARNLGGPQKFKGVAYVEYPSPGCRLIGFITGNFTDPQTKKATTSIFIPTSPNPMTGFVVLMDDDKVFKSNMTLEEAGKMILSAGLVEPTSYSESGDERETLPKAPKARP